MRYIESIKRRHSEQPQENKWTYEVFAKHLDALDGSSLDPKKFVNRAEAHFHHIPNLETVPQNIKDAASSVTNRHIIDGVLHLSRNVRDELDEIYSPYFARLGLKGVMFATRPDRNDDSGSPFQIIVTKSKDSHIWNPDAVVRNFVWIDFTIDFQTRRKNKNISSERISINTTRSENGLHEVHVVTRDVLRNLQDNPNNEYTFNLPPQQQQLIENLRSAALTKK